MVLKDVLGGPEEKVLRINLDFFRMDLISVVLFVCSLFSADVSKDEVLPEEWNPCVENPLELPHEEQEELWTSQEGEQLQGPEEAETTRFTFTCVPVKTEDDGEGSGG